MNPIENYLQKANAIKWLMTHDPFKDEKTNKKN